MSRLFDPPATGHKKKPVATESNSEVEPVFMTCRRLRSRLVKKMRSANRF